MAKKALPKIKTTKMGDLEEKVDSAPKKRGRPKKMQTCLLYTSDAADEE